MCLSSANSGVYSNVKWTLRKKKMSRNETEGNFLQRLFFKQKFTDSQPNSETVEM